MVRPVTVRNNGQTGLNIAESSTAIVVGGKVENNGGNGISVGRSSSARIGVSSTGLLGGVMVEGNARFGIGVETSHATILGSTIRGNGLAGIVLTNGAAARIGIDDAGRTYVGNTITGNGSNGIHVSAGASAFVGGNTIDANGVDAGASLGRSGIAVFSASVSLAGRNTVSNHPASGILVTRGSGLLVGDQGFEVPVTGPDANVITGNGAAVPGTRGGILVFQGGVADMRDSVITANHGAGIQVFQGAQVDVRRSEISGNVSVAAGFDGGHGIAAGLQSLVRVRGTSNIAANAGDGVQIFSDSGVDFRNESGAPVVAGNAGFGLQCFGTESSFSGDTSGVSSIGPGCTGF